MGSGIFASPVWSIGHLAQLYSNSQWGQEMLLKFKAQQPAGFQSLVFYHFISFYISVINFSLGQHCINNILNVLDYSAWFVGFIGCLMDACTVILMLARLSSTTRNVSRSSCLVQTAVVLGYFNYSQRWIYYRYRTGGANTLSISTTKQTASNFVNQTVCRQLTTCLWNLGKWWPIRSRQLNVRILNISMHMLRGVALLNGTQIDILTSWHTVAGVSISSDKRSETLSNNKTTMVLNLLSPQGHTSS
jgi:hypothetical protein